MAITNTEHTLVAIKNMITDKHQMDILQEYVLQFKKMKK
jgi:hypothetical protein